MPVAFPDAPYADSALLYGPAAVDPWACRAAALDWVNMIRAEYGLDRLDALPPGVPGSSSRCPVALALRGIGEKVSVSNSRLTVTRDGACQLRAVPPEVRRFIVAFDLRAFPSLIATANDEPVREAARIAAGVQVEWHGEFEDEADQERLVADSPAVLAFHTTGMEVEYVRRDLFEQAVSAMNLALSLSETRTQSVERTDAIHAAVQRVRAVAVELYRGE